MPTLEEVQTDKWTEIKQAREVAKYQPLLYLGALFDFDAEAQNNINGAVQAAQSAMIASQAMPPITWTLADNTTKNLTAQELLAIPFAGVYRTGAIYDKARILREEIYKRDATINSVRNITWV